MPTFEPEYTELQGDHKLFDMYTRDLIHESILLQSFNGHCMHSEKCDLMAVCGMPMYSLCQRYTGYYVACDHHDDYRLLKGVLVVC